jgi:hypothetical protein
LPDYRYIGTRPATGLKLFNPSVLVLSGKTVG